MGKVKELFEEAEEAERRRHLPVYSPYEAKELRHIAKLARQGFDPAMCDREMLYWLQAELFQSRKIFVYLHVCGGPSEARLHGYIAGVLGGYAMKVDPRIRAILTAIHNGEAFSEGFALPPPGPAEYHPGRPPPHKRRRAAREARAAAAAAGTAEVRQPAT